MIHDVLDFLRYRLNEYLNLKLDPTGNGQGDFIQLANVAWNDTNNQSTLTDGSNFNAFITLVNVEEDRISRPQENSVRKNNANIYKNPKIFLNLYVLFSVNLSSYFESLKRLSYIIQFFQYQNVFTPLSSPDVPEGVEKLILDLDTLSFQDLNNLWGIMGSKYLPSVLYKMRLIIIDENFSQGTAGLINEIIINDKTVNQ
ncbi:MAG: DUF4255 domain-containing protein [Ginsengibacter sp.]